MLSPCMVFISSNLENVLLVASSVQSLTLSIVKFCNQYWFKVFGVARVLLLPTVVELRVITIFAVFCESMK